MPNACRTPACVPICVRRGCFNTVGHYAGRLTVHRETNARESGTMKAGQRINHFSFRKIKNQIHFKKQFSMQIEPLQRVSQMACVAAGQLRCRAASARRNKELPIDIPLLSERKVPSVWNLHANTKIYPITLGARCQPNASVNINSGHLPHRAERARQINEAKTMRQNTWPLNTACFWIAPTIWPIFNVYFYLFIYLHGFSECSPPINVRPMH